MARMVFKELSNAKISETRQAVISENQFGGFTIGAQIKVNEGNDTTKVFLKNSLQIQDVECLQALRDAITIAIEKCANK